MEKHEERRKSQRSALVVREKLRIDEKMGLQTGGAGRKSEKRPKFIVGKL
jgi:hypothetical protein